MSQSFKENIMAGLGTTEILLIVLALFLLFGASRLPQLAKSIGQSKRAFKEGLDEAEREAKEEDAKKKISSDVGAPQISAMTDEEMLAEMRRRAEVKQS